MTAKSNPDPRVLAHAVAILDRVADLIDAGELVIIDGSTANRDKLYAHIERVLQVARGDLDASMLTDERIDDETYECEHCGERHWASDEDESDTWQQWQCKACGSWNDKATED